MSTNEYKCVQSSFIIVDQLPPAQKSNTPTIGRTDLLYYHNLLRGLCQDENEDGGWAKKGEGIEEEG